MGGKIKRNKLAKFVALLPLIIMAAIILPIAGVHSVLAFDGNLLPPEEYGIGIDIDDDERNLSVADSPFDDEDIAKTSHRIQIETPMRMGYSLVVNTVANDSSLSGINGDIPATSNWNGLTLPENSWGYAMERADGLHWSPVPSKNMPGGRISERSDEIGSDSFSERVYYGVNASMLTRAGQYSTGVNYTITAKMPTNPVFISMTPSEHDIDSNDRVLKFDGYNLDKTWLVHIDFNGDWSQTGKDEVCEIDRSRSTDTHMECVLPRHYAAGKYQVIISRNDGKGAIAYRDWITYYYQPELHSVTPNKFTVKKSVKLVDVADGGQGNKLYLTDDGEVYAVGAGYRVQNNVSWFDGVAGPMPVYFPGKGSDNPIIDIAAYNGSYYAVAKYGELYVWGINNHKQLGVDAGNYVDQPTKVSLGNVGVVKRVTAGENFTIILTSAGVYGFGSNSNFRIGCGVPVNGGCNTAETHIPQSLTAVLNSPLREGDEIVGIATGRAHGLMLSKYGRVYSWGLHDDGRLGWNTNSDANRPHEITNELSAGSHQIVKLVAGDNFSAALTAEGRVFTWGGNDFGQLGDSTTVSDYRVRDITNHIGGLAGDKITNLIVNEKSAAAWTNNGGVYAWGDNANNHLGVVGGAVVSVPTIVSGLGGHNVDLFYPGVVASTTNNEIYQYDSMGGWRDITNNFLHPFYLAKLTGKNMDKIASVWIDFNSNGKGDNDEIVDGKYYRYDSPVELTAQISTKLAKFGADYDIYVATSDGHVSVLPNAIKTVWSPLLSGVVASPNAVYYTHQYASEPDGVPETDDEPKPTTDNSIDNTTDSTTGDAEKKVDDENSKKPNDDAIGVKDENDQECQPADNIDGEESGKDAKNDALIGEDTPSDDSLVETPADGYNGKNLDSGKDGDMDDDGRLGSTADNCRQGANGATDDDIEKSKIDEVSHDANNPEGIGESAGIETICLNRESLCGIDHR